MNKMGPVGMRCGIAHDTLVIAIGKSVIRIIPQGVIQNFQTISLENDVIVAEKNIGLINLLESYIALLCSIAAVGNDNDLSRIVFINGGQAVIIKEFIPR